MKSPPDRVRLINRVNDALKALYARDMLADTKLGSPEPGTTAMVRVLAYCLTFVRGAVAHGIVDADFERLVAMARAHEAEGWEQHRKECSKCGGH